MVASMDSLVISHERRAELDGFLASLSSAELLYVRQKTKHLDPMFAGLENLPSELICSIMTHIDLSTFLNCRLVSKAWARTWSQDAAVTFMCRHVSPGLLKAYSLKDPKRLLLDELRIQKRRSSVNHLKSKRIPWDMNWDTSNFSNVLPRPLSIPPQESQFTSVQYRSYYAEDNVAWQPRRDLVIVDNLRTHQRHRVALTTLRPRFSYQLAAVSSQLIALFATQGQHTSNIIHVWHLQDRRFKSVHLPNTVEGCYADDDRIAMVTATGQIILWSWSGIAIQQNLGAVDDRPENVMVIGPAVLFDSNDADSVYAVWHHTPTLHNEQPLSTFVVAQLRGGHVVWQSRTSLRNPLADCQDNCAHDENIFISISCFPKKADNHGSYALGLYRLQSEKHTAPSPRLIHEGPWEMGDIGAVTFNVSTKTFGQYWFLFSEHEPFVWNLDDVGLMDLFAGPTAFHLFVGAYLWDRHLLVLYTSHDSSDAPDLTKLEILRPDRYYFPGSDDYEKRNFPDQLEITDGCRPTGEVFWDGDRVVVPTRQGLWVCEPREPGDTREPIAPLDIPEVWEGGFPGPNDLDGLEHSPHYKPLETHFHVQLNHGERLNRDPASSDSGRFIPT